MNAVLAGDASASAAAFTAGAAAACTAARRPLGTGALGAAARTHNVHALLPAPWILPTWRQWARTVSVKVTLSGLPGMHRVRAAHLGRARKRLHLGRRVSEPAQKLCWGTTKEVLQVPTHTGGKSDL